MGGTVRHLPAHRARCGQRKPDLHWINAPSNDRRVDNLAPRWFSKLHPQWRTPVHSILFMTGLVMAFILLSMLGVKEQEASQVLTAASVIHYAIAYVMLFALPLMSRRALRSRLPMWLKIAAAAGLVASSVSLFVGVYPIVDVVSY